MRSEAEIKKQLSNVVNEIMREQTRDFYASQRTIGYREALEWVLGEES